MISNSLAFDQTVYVGYN